MIIAQGPEHIVLGASARAVGKAFAIANALPTALTEALKPNHCFVVSKGMAVDLSRKYTFDTSISYFQGLKTRH